MIIYCKITTWVDGNYPSEKNVINNLISTVECVCCGLATDIISAKLSETTETRLIKILQIVLPMSAFMNELRYITLISM